MVEVDGDVLDMVGLTTLTEGDWPLWRLPKFGLIIGDCGSLWRLLVADRDE